MGKEVEIYFSLLLFALFYCSLISSWIFFFFFLTNLGTNDGLHNYFGELIFQVQNQSRNVLGTMFLFLLQDSLEFRCHAAPL